MTFKEFSNQKIIHPDDLVAKVKEIKQQNLTLATINGSFDLLHAGHLHILYEASKTADILLVALNSDASVKGYKGRDKPIVPLINRLEIITALAFVDYATWFEELDPRQLLSRIQPHVHVNGSEYGPHCVEADIVKTYGGRLHLVERIPGLATSAIINKIRAS